tara:strand:+ start:51 stop:476 length:426 start_codon:yes stop_codon:yes gene_type:complete
MARSLSDKEEQYAVAYVLQGGGKVKAYESAGYSLKMSKASISTQADKIFKKPHVSLRIKELQAASNSVVIQSKIDKLLLLEQVYKACMALDPDKGMVNAPSAIAAIKEHNLMQGDNAPIITEGILKVSGSLAQRLTGASKR